MTGRSHLVIGTASAATATAVTGCDSLTAAVVIAAAVGTAKLPDVDLTLGIKHRGPTHTLIALVLIGALVLVALSIDRHTVAYATAGMAGALIGYGMHLVADACTPHGVAVLAPFYRRDIHLLPRALRITTGSWQELVVVAIVTAVVLYFGAHAIGAA